MYMSAIRAYEKVVVERCYEDESGIFVQTDSGQILKYVGDYNLRHIQNSLKTGKENLIGTDFGNEYFALVDDIFKYSLR